MYHVVADAPAARASPTRYGRRDAAAVRPARVRRRRDPVPAHDERGHGRHGARRRRARRRGPARHRAARRPEPRRSRPGTARSTTRSCAGTASGATTCPTSTSSTREGINLTFFHCFPHYFVLPMYSSASSYRFRPLGPEETLMEIWSLTRFPEGERAREARRRPSVWAPDDPRWPPIPDPGLLEPARGSSGACTPGASSTCACRQALEGHISNFERTDRRLPRRPALRAAAARAAAGQRVPVRPSRSSTSGSERGRR